MATVCDSPTVTGVHIRAFYRQWAPIDDYSILLEGMDPGSSVGSMAAKTNRWTLMGFRPRQVLSLQGDMLHHHVSGSVSSQTITTADDLFCRLADALAQCVRHQPCKPLRVPFTGGLVGALGYGFSRWCDPDLRFLPAAGTQPDLLWCEFEDWVLIDRQTGNVHWFISDAQRQAAYETQWQHCIKETVSEANDELPRTPYPSHYVEAFKASLDFAAFDAAVQDIVQNIVAGNVYQANLSLQLQKIIAADPLALYQYLGLVNPSPFSGVFQWPEGLMVSNSPERLVKVGPEGIVETRPIAGTRGRGDTADEDQHIGAALQNHTKEQAEHVMLVDLLRNDLGRVSQMGTVTVDELMVLERYSHVTHLVSNVQGRLKPDVPPLAALKAVFPGGTITGCPKIRCMQILNRLEPVHRGFYTGSMGYIDAATGQMDWNILIRTLFLNRLPGRLRYNAAVHVGAGIVADSVASHEYRECFRKAAAILGALHYVESGPQPL